MANNKPFSEVIESSLLGWLAQSWQWNEFPAFGSLCSIKNKKRTLFGIVHQVQTGSMDPVRYPFPYKKTQEELLKEQPQIFEFLKTTHSCITIGYEEKGRMFYQLAPEPPSIHSFVTQAEKEKQQTFFAHEQYLHVLFGLSNQVFNLNELLLALINHMNNLGILTDQKIETIIETCSLLTGNDYRHLKLFLQRVDRIIKEKNI